jgi:hypothetical protein
MGIHEVGGVARRSYCACFGLPGVPRSYMHSNGVHGNRDRREGILSRKVSSVELFRIQNVVSLHPWRQRLFNIGTVVVTTSDPDFPRWYLHGMVDAQRLRNTLNWSAIALRDRKGIREFNIGRV